MWLTKKETAEKAESVKTGVVTTGGGEISVCTELERRAPTVTVPYGMAVSVPQGTEAVMTGGVCLGVVNDAGTLLPGEVRLFSAGGAEIVLKLDARSSSMGRCLRKRRNSVEVVILNGITQTAATGLPKTAEGLNALMQRAYNRICLKRGAFCYDRVLGSRFYMLDAADEHAEERALRYAQAALLPLADVEAVSVRREGERFIFGLQTMLGTGEIAVKGAKV